MHWQSPSDPVLPLPDREAVYDGESLSSGARTSSGIELQGAGIDVDHRNFPSP
jgi:hypothetical protein